MVIIKEGRLLKKGSLSWKTRYFILTNTKISYYVREGESKPRGELPLTFKSQLLENATRPFAFQVVTEDRSVTFCAASAEEEKEWRGALEEALEEAAQRPEGADQPGSGASGWQCVSAAGQDFEMPGKYELIKPIGHGAYGVVISALNHDTSGKVAIKKIPDTFEDLVDAKRIVREVRGGARLSPPLTPRSV